MNLASLQGGFILCTLSISVTCLTDENQKDAPLNCKLNPRTSLNGKWIPGEMDSVDLSHIGISVLPDLFSYSNAKSLNFSHNFLKTLLDNAFSGVPRLQSLDLTHNHISSIHNGTFAGLTSLKTLRLSYNRLQALDVKVFYGLEQLTTLQLGHNELSVIKNNTFSGLSGLRKLDLQGNSICRLELHAFQGLGTLAVLDLSQNLLKYEHSSFPPRVFASLASLQELYVQDNNERYVGEYPRNVFNDLTALRHLSVDTFHEVRFGTDFAQLKSLQTLHLDSNCRIGPLQNDSFDGLKNTTLEVIRFANCRTLFRIDACTFCNLRGLQSLVFSTHRLLGLNMVLQSLYGLQNQNMQQIIVDNIGWHLHRAVTLERSNAVYLRTICVKQLVLRQCDLQQITPQALYDGRDDHGGNLATCIEHLEVSKNRVPVDDRLLMTVLLRLKNLKSLRIERQELYSLQDSACVLSSSPQCRYRQAQGPLSGHVFHIPIPTNLSYWNLSAVTDYFNAPPTVFNFTSAYNLKTLDVSFGMLGSCLTTTIGLESLETLQMSGSYCDEINEKFFDTFLSLRQLAMSNCRLNQTYIRTRAQRLFRNLKRLEKLDLSRNWLIEIESKSLPMFPRLKELRLSYNSFQTIPVYLDLHPNLTVLDLSFNNVPSLTLAERQSLDDLASRQPVRMQLMGNPLLCACSNLDFVRWLRDTSVILDGEGACTRRYTCTAETGEITDTEQVIADMEYHWRQCIGQRVFGYTLAAFLLQLLVLLMVYLCARSWTHVRYFWNVARRLRLPRRQDFKKDVYVVYADQDVELACLKLPRCLQPFGVRLLLRHKEDQPGSIKAENIVTNIENSWKVLLLVTRAFASDDWSCGFTVQQAQRSITDTLPDRVVVVFMDDPLTLPPMASLEMLLRNYTERNVFHVHRDTPVEHSVWQSLAEVVLGHEF